MLTSGAELDSECSKLPRETFESWVDIPQWEGFYQISNKGRVKSLARRVYYRGGVKYYEKPETMLTPGLVGAKRRLYPRVVLCDGPRQRHAMVHMLMAESFLADSYFPGAQACHWDDNQFNNTIENIRWGTRRENKLDQVRNGNHHQSNKSYCSRNHSLLLSENLVPSGVKQNKRQCRACRNAISKAHRQKRAYDSEYVQFLSDEYYERITK